MGFLELHLHEPNFTLNTGGEESSRMFGRKKHRHGHGHEHGHGKHGKHGKHMHGKHKHGEHEHGEYEEGDEGPPSMVGKLVPLFVLLAVVAVARWRKRRRE